MIGSAFNIVSENHSLLNLTLAKMYATSKKFIIFISIQVMLERFIKFIQEPSLNDSEKNVMNIIAAIYGLWNLEKHLGHLFQYGILIRNEQVSKIHDTLLKLCKDLTPNAIALVDVIGKSYSFRDWCKKLTGPEIGQT